MHFVILIVHRYRWFRIVIVVSADEQGVKSRCWDPVRAHRNASDSRKHFGIELKVEPVHFRANYVPSSTESRFGPAYPPFFAWIEENTNLHTITRAHPRRYWRLQNDVGWILWVRSREFVSSPWLIEHIRQCLQQVNRHEAYRNKLFLDRNAWEILNPRPGTWMIVSVKCYLTCRVSSMTRLLSRDGWD